MAELKTIVNPLFLRDEDLRQGIELLFFAYRDMTARSDAMLAKQNFGRAHHRAIYFVGLHPGIKVSELLEILGITKQSLSRVLGQLIDEGFIEQRKDHADRRRRPLFLSANGAELEHLLTECQCRRIAGAYRAAGGAAVAGFRAVLGGIINVEDRPQFATVGRPWD